MRFAFRDMWRFDSRKARSGGRCCRKRSGDERQPRNIPLLKCCRTAYDRHGFVRKSTGAERDGNKSRMPIDIIYALWQYKGMKNTAVAAGIETPNGTLTAVQVIWDARQPESGWFLRCRYAEGSINRETDEQVDCLQDLQRDESEAELISCAFTYVFPPNGLTDRQMDALRSMIEVVR